MKALVTGAAGFVGRHLHDELERHGWDVVGVDLRATPGRSGCQELERWGLNVLDVGNGKARSVFLHADVRDIFKERSSRTFGFMGVLNELAETRFDLVAHCAYHVGGRAAINKDPSLLALNLELDAQLFDWAVRTRQHAVVYFSSAAAYPIVLQELVSASYYSSNGFGSPGRWVALTEDLIDLRNVRQPDARYGWAKLTGEQLAHAAAKEGLRVHVLRPFSGYGSDQDLTYPFPAVLRRVVAGDLSVWGNRGQYRDWIHIDDVVNGTLAVYQADYRQPVNLCSGYGVEFSELVIRMARTIGVTVDPEEIRYLPDQPTGVMVRVGDPVRMFTLYQPQISLEQGIERALATLGSGR